MSAGHHGSLWYRSVRRDAFFEGGTLAQNFMDCKQPRRCKLFIVKCVNNSADVNGLFIEKHSEILYFCVMHCEKM